MQLYFDIGGTSIRVAVSHGSGVVGAPARADTPRGFEEGLSLLQTLLQQLCGGEKPELVVGGLPGVFDKDHTALCAAPNLSEWVGQPLKERLSAFFGAPVYLENDAALGALGEAMRGAGKGSSIVGYLALGTGIGGARIVDGKIDRYTAGFEPGHQIIDAGKALCEKCETGELEAYAGGKAIRERLGKSPAEIDDPEEWGKVHEWLALGLHNATVFWSPECIVLGGSVTQKISVERLTEKVSQSLHFLSTIPLIKKGELGDVAGIYGAVEYARQLQNNET